MLPRARSSDAPGISAIVALGAFMGLSIWQWGERKDLIAGALRLD